MSPMNASRIGEAWSSLRGILRKEFTFGDIKDLVGRAGLEVEKLAHLSQGGHRSASKAQLLEGIERLLNVHSEDERDLFVRNLIKDIAEKGGLLTYDLEEPLRRRGWTVDFLGNVSPLDLKLTLEPLRVEGTARKSVEKCLDRLVVGDYDGAITSICGAVDALTEQLYSEANLGDHRRAGYQERVKKAFSHLEHHYLETLDWETGGNNSRHIWHNHQQAVNQAAYVLAFLRREYSDAHGASTAPRALVLRAINCGIFIIRSISELLTEVEEPAEVTP